MRSVVLHEMKERLYRLLRIVMIIKGANCNSGGFHWVQIQFMSWVIFMSFIHLKTRLPVPKAMPSVRKRQLKHSYVSPSFLHEHLANTCNCFTASFYYNTLYRKVSISGYNKSKTTLKRGKQQCSDLWLSSKKIYLHFDLLLQCLTMLLFSKVKYPFLGWIREMVALFQIISLEEDCQYSFIGRKAYTACLCAYFRG